MDHEISSSQLGEGLEGWDWTCMQLNDGTEVKAYRFTQGRWIERSLVSGLLDR